MTRAAKSFAAFAFGAVLFVAGVFAWAGIDSILPVAGIGVLLMLVGAGGLLSTQSRAQVRIPHPLIYGMLALAIAFHVFQNLTMMSTDFSYLTKVSADFSYGWFLWALMPYGIVLILACFEGTRLSAIAGAALALAHDGWNYYAVAQSTSSTAAINFIWVPIWNTIIVVPVATFMAWLLLRRRHVVSANAP
jgi:hypothetical protein